MRIARNRLLSASQEGFSRQSLGIEEEIHGAILRATHFLPTQGPISVFVHHNTLHSFENLPFEEAVVRGGELYRCEPYFSEDRYREELRRGRIRIDHLRQILLEDLGKRADEPVESFGTRTSLRLAMLQMESHPATDRELKWLLAETDLLTRFRSEVTKHHREPMIEQTRQLVLSLVESPDRPQSGQAPSTDLRELVQPLIDEFGRASIHAWSPAKWESFVLHLLWCVCRQGVSATGLSETVPQTPLRHRDLLLQAVGEDSDLLVDEVLIRFCGAFLDQGFSDWSLPERDRGFAASFANLYLHNATVTPAWMKGIEQHLKRIANGSLRPLDLIAESLDALGYRSREVEGAICQELLALRGWAGMLWQMETNVPWLPHPAPQGSLEQYLAIRLLLQRYAIAYVGKQWFRVGDPHAVRQSAQSHLAALRSSSEGLGTYTIFQLAQACGWSPSLLLSLSRSQWTSLVGEVEAFPSIERRRILHLGYERYYRNAALDALAIHSRRRRQATEDAPKTISTFHVSFCLDDREESIRRHLEEVDPDCETSSAAGFFAVAMYYRAVDQAVYRPLCPNTVTPKHYVTEQPLFSTTHDSQKRALRRRRLGQLTHRVHSGSRTLMGGWLTAVFGAIATFPMVARILAPRLAAHIRSSFGTFVRPPATELRIERLTPEPGSAPDSQGYSLDEMAGIVVRILQDIGLVKNFPRIVLMVGHGSSSLNNPHESAYSCGACSGGRGGPNARAFAMMANDPRVRRLTAERGLMIPEEVRFVGAFHNTCTDGIDYFDLDLLPRAHRDLFLRIENSLNEARARNAHERSRRFHSAPPQMTPSEALKHVEQRAEDLSQVRPEYNHASNALVLVGRRTWSRGLYMDRRAFVTSYDPREDDKHCTILKRILGAAVPVCAGINLEYYFSTVDTEGYGCGSKLPHNVTSMLGVMTGAASDLRPGLSQQMVEIHEPMRILFVIETTPENMLDVIEDSSVIASLVKGRWVQLAVINAETSRIQLYRNGAFEPYTPESNELPNVDSSIDWYRGRSESLGFASIFDPALGAEPCQQDTTAWQESGAL